MITHPHEKRDCTIARVPNLGPKTALHARSDPCTKHEGKIAYKNAGNRQNLMSSRMSNRPRQRREFLTRGRSQRWSRWNREHPTKKMRVLRFRCRSCHKYKITFFLPQIRMIVRQITYARTFMLAENQTKNIWYHRVSTRSATGMGAILPLVSLGYSSESNTNGQTYPCVSTP